MLSSAVLWNGLYYARFIWYLNMDKLHKHDSRYISSWRGRRFVDHSWQDTMEYHAILARTVEYILQVDYNHTMLLVHQVLKMHSVADCYDTVARHVRQVHTKQVGYRPRFGSKRLFDPVMLRRINPRLRTTWSLPRAPFLLFDLLFNLVDSQAAVKVVWSLKC
jgi:hypothetical protein